MAFHTEKDLKSNNARGKKVYILSKDDNTERKFEIKANKFYKKNLLSEKDSLLTSLQAEIQGGGA